MIYIVISINSTHAKKNFLDFEKILIQNCYFTAQNEKSYITVTHFNRQVKSCLKLIYKSRTELSKIHIGIRIVDFKILNYRVIIDHVNNSLILSCRRKSYKQDPTKKQNYLGSFKQHFQLHVILNKFKKYFMNEDY